MLRTRAGDLITGRGEPGLVQRIIRIAELPAFVGIGRSQIYEQIKRGEFPKPIPLGPRAVGWLETEVSAWQAKRIAQREVA